MSKQSCKSRQQWCDVRLKSPPGKMSLVFTLLLRLVLLTLFHRSHGRTKCPHRHLAVLHHLDGVVTMRRMSFNLRQ